MVIKTNKRIKNLTNIEAYGKFFDSTKDLFVSAVVLIAIFCAWGSAGFIETHEFIYSSCVCFGRLFELAFQAQLDIHSHIFCCAHRIYLLFVCQRIQRHV